MAFAKHSIFFLVFILFSFFQASPAYAIRNAYIVYLGSHSHGREATKADLDRVTESHHELLGSFLGGSKEAAKEAMVYSYTRFINAFAAVLDDNVAAEIGRHPKVLKVMESKKRKLHTTHSWELMFQTDANGAALPHSTFKRARYGADVVIAHVDTGVWPESQSFSDEGMGPIPSGWKGACDIGKDPFGFRCNRKLIGARYFNKGFISQVGASLLNQIEYNTPRDYDGHGSHTLSTAGGSFVHGVNIFGRLANGTASGGSPRARVATYKVCWLVPGSGDQIGCDDADILAALDMAIHDGVNVLSLSIGFDIAANYKDDAVAIGAFHAYKNGINVVFSAGNGGISGDPVANVAPWMISVAASTMDRDFQARVQLQNGKILAGASFSKTLPQGRFYPTMTGVEARRANSTIHDAKFCCEGTIDPKKVKDKILVCMASVEDNSYSRMSMGYEALNAGAAAIILCNNNTLADKTDDGWLDPHPLPAVRMKYQDAIVLLAYLKSTKNPMVTIHPPTDVFNAKPSPMVADFSSRGPNPILPEILKPDVAAPGVNILAAYSPLATITDLDLDNRRNFSYYVVSGTSMACPHVAGVVGLLKTLHPDWSPAAIRSAIMTTAMTRDNTDHPMLAATSDSLNYGIITTTKATPFDYGSGHIRPNKAIDPGLVYDLTLNDYLDVMCVLNYNSTDLRLFYDAPYKCPYAYDILNFNYPAITLATLYGSTNVTRTLKNVGSPATYVARVFSPPGLSINVEPKTLKFDKLNEERSFTLMIDVTRHGYSTAFGRIIWSDGKHFVRSPISVNGVKV